MRRAAVFVLLLGCGLNEAGERDVLDASGDVVAIDVVSDVKEEPVVCSDAGVASCTDAVPFRSPVLYSPDTNTPCPAGYDTRDLVLSVPGATTCACNCTDAGPPSCDTTLVSYHYGGAGVCTVGSGGYTLSGSCTATTQQTVAGEFLEIDPPKVTGGCGGGTPVTPATTITNTRLCTPKCASDESVCTPKTGLRACVAVAGDVKSCPSNYSSGPFFIGSNPQTTCDQCACVQKGDCTGSTLHGYSDTSCGPGDQGFAMDGQCHGLTGGHVGTFNSVKITPTITNATCDAPPSTVHTTYVADEFTVCCQ